jgi:hypothetical protein
MFGWLFRPRRGSCIPPQPPAARDWAAGDGAKCIAGGVGGWVNHSGEVQQGPKFGELVRVIEVVPDDTIYLRFGRWPSSAYAAGNFKKLRPCSTDFREQIRNGQPVPVRNLELVR